MDASTNVESLAHGYRLSLEAGNSPATVAVYLSALERFSEWLEANGRPAVVEGVTRTDLEGFIATCSPLEPPPPRTIASGRSRPSSGGASTKGRSSALPWSA